MPLMAPDVGIDLGTANLSVYVRGRGVVINEPTLVVIDRKDRRSVRAVGDEARFLLGRSPEALLPVWPIHAGNVSDFDMTEIMLRYFMRKAIGVSHLVRPRVLVSTPCNLNDVNRKAMMEAVMRAGAKHVILVEKPFAAALGAGLPVYDPIGSMVVDIGAGTTDAAIISLGGTVVSQSVPMGGDRIDEAIMQFMKRECNVMIGKNTAESVKMDLATAMPLEEPRSVMVRGINQLNTAAGTTHFSSVQAYEAVKESCVSILGAVKWVLERTPPELAADIMRNGIHLTGGGSRLFALDRYISTKLGIPVILTKDPDECTILGIGYLTENIHLVLPQEKKGIYRD